MSYLDDIISFTGEDYYGYGCVVGNDTNKKDTETVAYQDMLFYFRFIGIYEGDIALDRVWVNVKKRPELERIISELKRNDRIYMSDVSHLLGTTNKARDYYKMALEKGIEILIADFKQNLFHLHPLSALLPASQASVVKFDVEAMLKRFDDYVETYTPPSKGGRGRLRIDYDSPEWKRLYFAYESYQVSLTDVIGEKDKKSGEVIKVGLGNQFGITNYPTFVNAAEDYERSLVYFEDTLGYTELDPDFLNLPKRIAKRDGSAYLLPEEYLTIKRKAEEENIIIDINIDNYTTEGFVEKTGAEKLFYINNIIYKRYQNLETMRIPRKLRDVNIFFE